jgi:hypothetical protein
VMLVLTGTPADLRIVPFPESLEPLDQGQSRVTFINMIQSDEAFGLQHDGADLASPLNFTWASPDRIVPSGETTFDITQNTVGIIEYTVNLRERYEYHLILAGTPADPVIIFTQAAMPGRSHIRAINASSALPAVDIYLDDDLVAGNLEYTRATNRLMRPAGSYTASVYHAGNPPAQTSPLGTFPVLTNNDDNLTLILLGTENDLRLIPFREDLSPTAPDEARVAFINTRSDVLRVQLDTQTGLLSDIGSLGYGQSPVVANLPLINHSFFWNALEDGQVAEQLETASNVQFEAGRSYLYLFTGSGVDQPVILSESVGISTATTTGLDGEISPGITGDSLSRIRFLNVLENTQPLDLLVNGELITTRVPYGQSADAVGVPDGDGEFEIVISGSETVIVAAVDVLEPGMVYTLAVYGDSPEDAHISLVRDTDLLPSATSASFRLFNASTGGDAVFGLAYSPAQTIGQDSSIQPPDSETNRRSMTIGMEPVFAIRDIQPGEFSPTGRIPIGIYALHILDTLDSPDSVAGSTSGFQLEPGQHYDVIVYQEAETRLVRGLVVSYRVGIETGD